MILGPNGAFDLVLRIAALGTAISSVELLVSYNLFKPEALLSWKIGQLTRIFLVAPHAEHIFSWLYRFPNVLALIGVRVALAIGVILSPSPLVGHLWLVSGLALVTLLLTIRHPYGQDGADQMSLIILVGATFPLLTQSPRVLTLYLWFVALQCSLAYSTAGFAKTVARGWRDGSYLTQVMGTTIYGHSRLFQFLKARQSVARLLSLLLIIWETSFPLVIISPRSVSIGILSGGVVFHVLNGYFMGLNTFIWAFIAAYPAVLYCIYSRGW